MESSWVAVQDVVEVGRDSPPHGIRESLGRPLVWPLSRRRCRGRDRVVGLLEAIIERPVSANPLVKKGVRVVRRQSGSGWLFAGCWQLMSAHLEIIRVLDPRYLQLIWIENRAVCRSACGCLQAATASQATGVHSRILLNLL